MSVGRVFIVGAGPGDPGLLTLRAVELIRKADVILYDYLCGEGFLAFKREDAECIYIGKRGHQHYTPQEDINRLLLEKAQVHRAVVRLKGGDPFVFGRGGEEAEYLRRHGVPFEIVPGVTSSIAAPAYAGIPVTHRDYSSSVSIVTGHRQAGRDLEEVIVPNTDTIVYMMGVTNLPNIAGALLRSGRSPETPVAIIRWGTRPQQRTIVGTIENIAELAVKEKVNPPSVVVVGEVVRLREELSWYESLPDWKDDLPVENAGDKALPFRTRKPSALSGGEGAEK
jgi:uroporphyrinogen III methyltransferase/synthase